MTLKPHYQNENVVRVHRERYPNLSLTCMIKDRTCQNSTPKNDLVKREIKIFSKFLQKMKAEIMLYPPLEYLRKYKICPMCRFLPDPFIYYTHTHAHKYTHMHIHPYIHTYIHTYTPCISYFMIALVLMTVSLKLSSR